MEPEFPMNRYFTPCRLKASRISWACLYSNAAISEPIGQVLLAPLPVRFHRVKGAKRRIVENRFISADKRVAHTLLQRSLRRSFKLFLPLTQNLRFDHKRHDTRGLICCGVDFASPFVRYHTGECHSRA